MEHDGLGVLAQASTQMTRRAFLRAGALTALTFAGGSLPHRVAGYTPVNAPFSLGVASGEPTHESVVLWTRLAADPLNRGGMAPAPVAVNWQVATDARMLHIVRQGRTLALPERAHAVHVRVGGLAPDRWYWYRFQAGGDRSVIGRTRTLPAPDSAPRELRFAFVSCQNFEAGFFTAYQQLAQENIDFVIHLGDYIYEENTAWGRVRDHYPRSEPVTLDEYRNRHAQYKCDPYLQAAHAQFPFLMTWDDHEVADNYAGNESQKNRDDDGANDVPESDFRSRRRNAYQAYYEHMPLDPALALNGANLRLYRRFQWGRLATLHLLDTRQYRSRQPCAGAKDLLNPVGDDVVVACGEEQAESATIAGFDQEQWLFYGMRGSRARWNVIAQQVMMAALDFGPGVGTFDPRFARAVIRNADTWDGYAAARNRLLSAAQESAVRNLVVLSGDVHTSWVNDLKLDSSKHDTPVVATEFVGMSISSHFPTRFIPIVQAALRDPVNGHVKFFDGTAHGYVRCTVTPEHWRSDYRVVDTVALPNANVRTLKSFIVEDRQAGAAIV